MKNKKILLIALFGIILLIVGIVYEVIFDEAPQNKKTDESENTTPDAEVIIEDTTSPSVDSINFFKNMNITEYDVGDYVITDAELVVSNTLSTFYGTLISKSNEKIDNLKVVITIYDKNNEELKNFYVELFDIVKDEERDLYGSFADSMRLAYSIKIEIEKE